MAWIDDTNTKVIVVALDMIAHGRSSEEIHLQHPHLSLAQIHAALGYYYDHQTEWDAQMRRGLCDVDLASNAAWGKRRNRRTGANMLFPFILV